MKVIIIEDEKPAADKLRAALQTSDSSIKVISLLKSISESVIWLKQNPMPDLIFLDIELSDGLSFAIFDEVKITCPIIFTTAYDDYWQEAFEHNSIDYLLKPVKQEKLSAALAKYNSLKEHFAKNLQQLLQHQQAPVSGFKKRFLIKKGIDYASIRTDDIAYFYATHKLVCLVDLKGNKFILDQSLSDMEKQLDPAHFYRINRKYLVNINAIRKIKAYAKSKLHIEIYPPSAEEIIISQENVSSFKNWMGQ